MKITIDEFAGFCPGVQRVIQIAEQRLNEGKKIVALGSIIHNEKEIDRLKTMGLRVIPQEHWASDPSFKDRLNGDSVLIRSHGVPPEIVNYFEQEGIPFINATCARVVRVQRLVKKYADRGYQIVVVGKPNHPEVMGLLGNAGALGVLVYNPEDMVRVDLKMKTLLVAQTTIDEDRFQNFAINLKKGMKELVVTNTICPVIKSRHTHMAQFARAHDVIVLIAGPHSSNSLVLFNLCKTQNSRSYFISDARELQPTWFENAATVGVTGGASTPRWQLIQVRDAIWDECSKKIIA
ncbi:MAG: 4-hydroxy-3-methylbut-2-enyl diphosphate reductase [Candidatus Zhuqueibacterota bacterium]